jgi:hypothetical protein
LISNRTKNVILSEEVVIKNLTPSPSPVERGAFDCQTPLSTGEGLGVRF